MKLKVLLVAAGLLTASAAVAKTKILVNPEVTTHIIMPESIKLVDISSNKMVGNQCADNIVRVKPRIEDDGQFGDYYPGEPMGTVTVIGERHMAQIDLEYTQIPYNSASMYIVNYEETVPYINPDVSMPSYEMARYAWAVYSSGRKYNNINSTKHGIKASINNIYSVGDYFFIDYTLENKTNIPYDIDEQRIKLTDKKEVKATNSQTTELTPVYNLNGRKKFKRNYRNVMVLERLTFPDEKVLTLEITENQISGRIVTLSIEYEDVLNADGFDDKVLQYLPQNWRIYTNTNTQVK